MKKTLLAFSCLLMCVIFTNAQNETMYIMKGNAVVGQHNVSTEIDSIIFYDPTPVTPPDPSTQNYISGKIPNAKYIGRWDTSSEWDMAYWPGTYMKVKFTGTSAKIVANARFSWQMGFAYSVDGGALQYVTGNDLSAYGYADAEIALASGLTAGTHTLIIASGNGQDLSTGDEILQIKNLILDPGATTLAPDLGKHVEFIGDSITMGWNNEHEVFDQMGWLIGEELNIEHTNIARSGITTGGMSSAYFQTCYTGNTTPWDFQNNYHPDLIFINLGQNDGCVNQSTYGGFVTDLRAVHPNAIIVCMIPFNSNVNACSKDAINAVAATDPNVFVEDGLGTMIGLINGIDYHDSVELHPNETGNRKAADYFKPIIASYLGL